MPINICASPTFNKERNLLLIRMDEKWQREIEEKPSTTCRKMDGGHAHSVKEQE